MAQSRYIGTTIGPIFDVMSFSSTPAALWASSYLFSHLSKCICEELVKKGVDTADIIAPYYEKDSEIIRTMTDKGVGMFYDHIIFRQKEFRIEEMIEVRAAVLDRVSEDFSIDRDYLEDFILISAVSFEADYADGRNPLLVSSRMFDSLELSKKVVPVEKSNPILNQFTGVDENDRNTGKNELIKKIVLDNLGCSDWQLLKRDNSRTLKSLESIQSGDYYAIVRADGDDMGKYIASLSSDEQLRTFSEECFTYCRNVADKVKDFGGITIYAGGDDLLAITPCVTKDGRTVLDFVKEAQECFAHKLSFGISVCYTKFPLYEALADSADLLFGDAKNRYVDGRQKKHNTAIRIRKHSGQTESFLIGNETLDALIASQHAVTDAKAGNKEEVFLSALHKLAMFRELFDTAAAEENAATIQAVFDNVFDAHDQNTAFLHRALPDMFSSIVDGRMDIVSTGTEESGTADTLSNVLRMFKFFIERSQGK